MSLDRLKTNWQRELFLRPELAGKKIAIQDDKVVCFADTYEAVIEAMRKQSRRYSLYAVPRDVGKMRIISFQIKTFKRHPWTPLYSIDFHLDDSSTIAREMLIDSGADISIINYDFGRLLGFEKSAHEVELEAERIGGCVAYVLRTMRISIAGHRFENVFAWLQDEALEDMIIGRETVFDLFDIEFKQADEQILFKYRG